MARDLMDHRGILREDNIALRQILGYRTESIESSPYRVPQIGQCPPSTYIKDLLIVAIDVDNPRCQLPLQEQSYHIGLSILDTRCFASKIDDTCKAIASFQFINNDSRPCHNAKKRFLFGETETMSLSCLAPRLAELIKGRDYVLVGHGMKDLKFLKEIDPNIAGKAGHVLDTGKIAQFPLQLYYRYSLEKLLEELDIQYANLHAAGNDAHFTLKALLMLAVRDGLLGQHRKTLGEEELFLALETIAHAPVNLPVWTDEPPAKPLAAKKKEKIGVYAKRRLKAESKSNRRVLQDVPFAEAAIGMSETQEAEH